MNTINPFANANGYQVITVEDRLQRVRNFNAEQCLQALAMPHLQKTVQQAVERRLRMLEAEARRR